MLTRAFASISCDCVYVRVCVCVVRVPGADARVQQYLSADEFKKVFNMTKEEYNALPGWKRLPMRKTANLF